MSKRTNGGDPPAVWADWSLTLDAPALRRVGLGHLAGGDSPRGSPWNGCGWAAETLNGVVNHVLHNWIAMCMVAYIASRSPLPLIPWSKDAPAFNIAALTEHEQPVLHHLTLPHVRQAGSHTGCGCGFNEGREYPEAYEGREAELAGALESSSRLVRYVWEHRVEQIYSCWSGDEGEPQAFSRRVTPETLVSPDFFFRERELLTIDFDTA